jgi:hypothetical protein
VAKDVTSLKVGSVAVTQVVSDFPPALVALIRAVRKSAPARDASSAALHLAPPETGAGALFRQAAV